MIAHLRRSDGIGAFQLPTTTSRIATSVFTRRIGKTGTRGWCQQNAAANARGRRMDPRLRAPDGSARHSEQRKDQRPEQSGADDVLAGADVVSRHKSIREPDGDGENQSGEYEMAEHGVNIRPALGSGQPVLDSPRPPGAAFPADWQSPASRACRRSGSSPRRRKRAWWSFGCCPARRARAGPPWRSPRRRPRR